MTAHTHNCSATGCTKQIPLNLPLCMTHWRMVPAPLQRAVQDAWRAMNRGGCALALVRAHSQAEAKAIEAVHARLFRKIAVKARTAGDLFDEFGL